jgi:N-acetylmuramoyl-L-alanine amidase
MKKLLAILFFLLALQGTAQQMAKPLTGKTICVDPGHGGTALTDSYRVGPSGEREEWINLRVGLMLQKMLEEKGAKVLITRTEDKVVSLPDRAKLAVENKADLLFRSITMRQRIRQLIFRLFIFTAMRPKMWRASISESSWQRVC